MKFRCPKGKKYKSFLLYCLHANEVFHAEFIFTNHSFAPPPHPHRSPPPAGPPPAALFVGSLCALGERLVEHKQADVKNKTNSFQRRGSKEAQKREAALRLDSGRRRCPLPTEEGHCRVRGGGGASNLFTITDSVVGSHVTEGARGRRKENRLLWRENLLLHWFKFKGMEIKDAASGKVVFFFFIPARRKKSIYIPNVCLKVFTSLPLFTNGIKILKRSQDTLDEFSSILRGNTRIHKELCCPLVAASATTTRLCIAVEPNRTSAMNEFDSHN